MRTHESFVGWALCDKISCPGISEQPSITKVSKHVVVRVTSPVTTSRSSRADQLLTDPRIHLPSPLNPNTYRKALQCYLDPSCRLSTKRCLAYLGLAVAVPYTCAVW